MNNKKNNINKDLLKKKEFLKSELKKIVLKSVIQNLNLKTKIRALALKKLTKLKIKSSISYQNNNICLKTGKIKGLMSKIDFSRHFSKKLGSNGFLQNIKIKSW